MREVTSFCRIGTQSGPESESILSSRLRWNPVLPHATQLERF